MNRRTRRALGAGSALAACTLITWGLAPAAPAQESETLTYDYTGAAVTYRVPADGSICSVTFSAVAGDGGSGDATPGTGGSIEGTVPVAAGDTLTIVVGGVGGEGADFGPSDGGFGGGGDGGPGGAEATDLDGGGGGGASYLLRNDVPLLVAGGGGGGGAYNMDGGNGSEGPGAGDPGEELDPEDFGWGASGAGGTNSSAGLGGDGGLGDGTEGGAGANGGPLLGGNGGVGDGDGSGGGGGGGAGYMGGGGGGGAADSGSGGGGGGGASYASADATAVGSSVLFQDPDGNGVAELTPIPGDCPPATTTTTLATTTTTAAANAAVVTPRFTG